MNANEIRLIQDVFAHYSPDTELDEETINALFLQKGTIRAVLRDLITQFEPKAHISEEYLDAKLKTYGIFNDAVKSAFPNRQIKNKNLILIGVIVLCVSLFGFGVNYYQNKSAGTDDDFVVQDSTAVDVVAVDTTMVEAVVPEEIEDYSSTKMHTNESESDYTSRGGNGVVTVRKAYFYNSTNLNSRTNSFIVEGQTIVYSNYEGDFIYAYYTNDSGKITEGWMLKTDFEIEPFD
jgi:hypothetical protein